MIMNDELFKSKSVEFDIRANDIDYLKKLHDSIKPENIIKQKIIDGIKLQSEQLMIGKSIIIDLNMPKINKEMLLRIIEKFKKAGFKAKQLKIDGTNYVVIKL